MDWCHERKRNSLLEFCHQEGSTLGPSPLVPDGVLNRNLVENGTIVQLNGGGISDRPPLGIVVLGRISFVLNTSDLGTESVNSWVSGSGVSATQG